MASLTTPDLVVLAMLAEESMHGYQLNNELERRDVKDWAGISRPQVYYSLKKLRELKLINPANSESSAGPERQVFAVSKNGMKKLAEALDEDRWALERIPPRFLTWMALSIHADRTSVGKLIEKRKQFLLDELAREKSTIEEIRSEDNAMTKVGVLMVSLTIRQFEVELQWLEEVRNTLC
ncbi:MAG: PadR family transcriptional regulator [Candidatus Obscuribacterales bacterium]|jgi:DNA-binding PadR family transcriptional regulator|nr:PadR family transcriptional regulator [Candidatus Obscuribacterales bacterium]